MLGLLGILRRENEQQVKVSEWKLTTRNKCVGICMCACGYICVYIFCV